MFKHYEISDLENELENETQKSKRNCETENKERVTQNSLWYDVRNNQKDVPCYETFIASDETFQDSANSRSNMKPGDIKMKIHNITCKERFDLVFTENSYHLAR